MVNVIVRRERQGTRAERLEKLHVALAMIGSGMLSRNTEVGVRSEELGVGGIWTKTLNVQRSTLNAQVRSP